ncbi:MAG: hypothetical protein OCD01_05005 [Fibrobacterales bacterium]
MINTLRQRLIILLLAVGIVQIYSTELTLVHGGGLSNKGDSVALNQQLQYQQARSHLITLCKNQSTDSLQQSITYYDSLFQYEGWLDDVGRTYATYIDSIDLFFNVSAEPDSPLFSDYTKHRELSQHLTYQLRRLLLANAQSQEHKDLVSILYSDGAMISPDNDPVRLYDFLHTYPNSPWRYFVENKYSQVATKESWQERLHSHSYLWDDSRIILSAGGGYYSDLSGKLVGSDFFNAIGFALHFDNIILQLEYLSLEERLDGSESLPGMLAFNGDLMTFSGFNFLTGYSFEILPSALLNVIAGFHMAEPCLEDEENEKDPDCNDYLGGYTGMVEIIKIVPYDGVLSFFNTGFKAGISLEYNEGMKPYNGSQFATRMYFSLLMLWN